MTGNTHTNTTRRNKFIIWASVFLLATAAFSSCTEIEVFEKNTVIPNMQWQNNFSAKGTVKISDTASSYNIYIIIRHNDAYAYNNIWLNVGLQPPGDSMQYQKINLTLGNDAGGWEGSGMNDIWEVRKLISGLPKRFIKKGEYNFSVQQIMRDDPLKGIMNAGIRLQKAG